MKSGTERSALLAGLQRLVFFGDSLTDGSTYPDYVWHRGAPGRAAA